ncbi:hypothetical protein EJ110_NYTH49683 [Nymphaea thermarum]|nr:hypothetical protein EJ110_NYTH49683 [Nymphaea thermarum]
MRREMEAGTGGRAMLVMVVVAATLVASHIGGVGGQTQPDCAAKLIPCMDAVSNTSMKPGKECCSALGDAIKNELKCLCVVYNSSGILESLKVNKTRALEIPGLCGLSNDLSHCSSGIVSLLSGICPLSTFFGDTNFISSKAAAVAASQQPSADENLLEPLVFLDIVDPKKPLSSINRKQTVNVSDDEGGDNRRQLKQ